MDFQKMMQAPKARANALAARFGVEREGQRVRLQDGALVTTPHPKLLGNRKYHPYIQTDFAETQLELITPVTESPEELMAWLAALHDVAGRSMAKEEALWPLSMPPQLPTNQSEIKLAELDNFEDVLYRRYLARQYGRRKQMVSGIHFNFEFGETLVQALFDQQQVCQTLEAFKTELYMKVTRNYLRYRWLITYLYGATPTSEPNYFVEDPGPAEPVRSIRNSAYGYRNYEDVQVSYASLERYLQDISKMVDLGHLSEEKEFYSPLRLRGGKRVQDLADSGIRYIELRNIDLQPFDRYGFYQEEAQFLQVFLLLMLWLPEEADADDWVREGDRRNDAVALERPDAMTACLPEGEWLLTEMEKMIAALHLSLPVDFLSEASVALADPETTPAAQLWLASQVHSQHEVATKLAQANHYEIWQRPYQLAGFTGMELSTQILLFDAIQQGVKVTILDEADQFLQLNLQGHIEYVKNANMTAKDSYVVPLMMANKTVTKKVLAKAGFRVPKGGEYGDLATALAAYPKYDGQAIVVKPKSTNYGLGISVFKEAPAFSDYETAVRLAFAEDTAILVEEFLPGTEYRFFVLDGKVEGIMLRVPANVVGDGERTIAQLVASKNEDPLRGTHHRSPLELIQLGEIEKLMLKEQGYQVDSVPAAGVTVYLRENSNVSTGGDSIDMTDEFNEDYKAVAVAAVEALGAKISGIDLIIPDKSRLASEPGAYGIIEANFNPAMHMHVYPYQGQGRRLTMVVLQFLYPELAELNLPE